MSGITYGWSRINLADMPTVSFNWKEIEITGATTEVVHTIPEEIISKRALEIYNKSGGDSESNWKLAESQLKKELNIRLKQLDKQTDANINAYKKTLNSFFVNPKGSIIGVNTNFANYVFSSPDDEPPF